jgi:hypothetical protein
LALLIRAFDSIKSRSSRVGTGFGYLYAPPFGKLIKREVFNQKHNQKIIKATLSVATRMKVAFETDSKGKGLKSQLKKFSDSVAVVRNNIVIVVETLLSIGR